MLKGPEMEIAEPDEHEKRPDLQTETIRTRKAEERPDILPIPMSKR